MSEKVREALKAVEESKYAMAKFLSRNDSGENNNHQAGFLIPKGALEMVFDRNDVNKARQENQVLTRTATVYWPNDQINQTYNLKYYSSKNELRITSQRKFKFPYRSAEYTGALWVLTREDDKNRFKSFVFSEEYEIEEFLEILGLSPADLTHMIDPESMLVPQHQKEMEAISRYIRMSPPGFPRTDIISKSAREIEEEVYAHPGKAQTEPDTKLLNWLRVETDLFYAIEKQQLAPVIQEGFLTEDGTPDTDKFIKEALSFIQRRKSRAGKSLEIHLKAIFQLNGLDFDSQVRTEQNKKPDFIFPGKKAYHDPDFPDNQLVFLGAKTTCKDRWRQILNEADRFKGRTKFLITLQEEISENQLDEMEKEKVILIIPEKKKGENRKKYKGRVWTLKDFISHVKTLQKGNDQG